MTPGAWRPALRAAQPALQGHTTHTNPAQQQHLLPLKGKQETLHIRGRTLERRHDACRSSTETGQLLRKAQSQTRQHPPAPSHLVGLRAGVQPQALCAPLQAARRLAQQRGPAVAPVAADLRGGVAEQAGTVSSGDGAVPRPREPGRDTHRDRQQRPPGCGSGCPGACTPFLPRLNAPQELAQAESASKWRWR